MLQRKKDANISTEIVHVLGSSTLFLAVIETLAFLQHISMALQPTYTAERAKKTEDHGDCCMMSIVEWGHARLEYEDDLSQFEDQDHMDYTGEFTFRVNETCLPSDHNIFMVAPTDRDSHNPILVHLNPSDMVWGERRNYIPYEMKRRRHEKGNTEGEQEEGP